ncbi:DUF2189 domain-containing protein [Thiomicrorhabdus indica]|uniref:DUF2189 domain-containing protein n=1 Tax=Thiomicrorhabdus indica TaxID=2267253 RepID=UPI002AA92312|nr:DUF2189 domain-containing protein [Thiomicrorhabdus indica]
MTSTYSSPAIHDHVTEKGEHIVSKDVQFSHIGHWLKKGWMDMAHAPLASFFYGSIMAFSVLLVFNSFQEQPIMMFKVATFFVMLSPFLATGLYAVSIQLHKGDKPHLLKSMVSWRHNLTEFALFALALGIIIAIWSRVVPLIAAIVNSNSLLIVDPNAGIMSFLTSDVGLTFMTYFMISGAAVSAVVFALSVVTIPLLLRDRNIGVIQAMILSFKVVMHNKAVMAVWALIIGALISIGIVTFGIAMLVIMPLLGYASWHAFNDLIEIDPKTEIK